MSTKSLLRQASAKAPARKLKLDLLNTSLRPSKKARTCFEGIADTVDEISGEGLPLYLTTESASLFPAALQTILTDISKGEFIPECAERFVCRIFVLLCKMDPTADMEAIEGGDQQVLDDSTWCLRCNRAPRVVGETRFRVSRTRDGRLRLVNDGDNEQTYVKRAETLVHTFGSTPVLAARRYRRSNFQTCSERDCLKRLDR